MVQKITINPEKIAETIKIEQFKSEKRKHITKRQIEGMKKNYWCVFQKQKRSNEI